MATLTQTENRIRPLYIDGYTHQLSYAPGEEIEFNVSTSAGSYSLEIARIGATREVVWSQAELPGEAQPIPEDASSQGCRWSPTFTLEVPESWQSGYYEGYSAPPTVAVMLSIGTIVLPKARCFSLSVPRSLGQIRLSCFNSLPILTTPTTTGVASVFTGITAQARYKGTVSRLIGPPVVFSVIGSGFCYLGRKERIYA